MTQTGGDGCLSAAAALGGGESCRGGVNRQVVMMILYHLQQHWVEDIGDSTEISNSWVHSELSHPLPLHRLQIYFSFRQSHPQCYKKWYIRSNKTLEIL